MVRGAIVAVALWLFGESIPVATAEIAGCAAVSQCLDHSECAQCLSAVNATAGFSHTYTEFYDHDHAATRALYVGVFQTLMSTASCSPSSTSPALLYAALQELGDFSSPCNNAYHAIPSSCIVAEYACFIDINCQPCFSAIFSAGNVTGNSNGTSKAEAIRQPACIATNPTLMISVMSACVGYAPVCSFYKQLCAFFPECLSCLAMLVAGDGSGAARECPGATSASANALNVVAVSCFGSISAGCGFVRQKCADRAFCGPCLAGMGNGHNARAIAAEWATPACQSALQDPFSREVLFAIPHACAPGISACRNVITDCVYSHGAACFPCVDGSALTTSQVKFCSSVSREFSLGSVCQPCDASVYTINSVVFATATVGGASAAVCVAVAMTILAHSRDRVSMRDRIVVELMLTNAVYSTANAIPLNALRTGALDCGRLAMSFDAIRFGRAWWFCGKYGLVSFELLILGTSIRALLCDKLAVFSPCTEAVMHAACWTVAALAFAVFCTLCAGINSDGYNTATENEVYTNTWSHPSFTDDVDDIVPSVAATSKFQSARDAYDNLVRDMLVAWDVVVGVAIGLWIVLRVVHQLALRALRIEAAQAARAEEADEWGDTRRGAWEARRMLLEARRDAFRDVAKPLEPYIFVFLVFSAPAFVMSTPFCQHHSGANAAGGESGAGGNGFTDFTYGVCDVWCEFVLAFRSLGTIVVYLVPRERRAELVAVRTTWRKLCTRVVGCVRCTPAPHMYALLRDNHGEWHLNDVFDVHAQGDNVPSDDSALSSATPTDMSAWRINPRDVVMETLLGAGAFGEVWAGTLGMPALGCCAVAIKVLFAGEVDEDGDLVDPYADEDFYKECAALQRVDSPHLIKFYGFGKTAEGNGFIVTELMAGGSLEDVLHDPACDLPWPLRVRIGLQVSLGMEHLHKKQMLHRDLKSANVLVDEKHTQAKVCDFGLSRVVKPARQHIAYSPFTGTVRFLPRVDSATINNRRSSLSTAHISVSISDAHGTLTKAAGTLQWMAPEVFRGDRGYTNAVDVYSFGVVLWELATRKMPWVDDIADSGTETSLFNGINLALKTGRRPTVPTAVLTKHESFVAVMGRCWAGDPVDRPTFSQVTADLAVCLRKYT